MREVRNRGDDMGSGENSLSANTTLHYAEEILCANWNPLALAVAEPLHRARAPAVDGNEVDALLARLYCCQQA
jgi:hypothetical protein